jgi:hypothetical protein
MSRIAAARSGPARLCRVWSLAVDGGAPSACAHGEPWPSSHRRATGRRSGSGENEFGRAACGSRTALSHPLTQFRHSDASSVLLLSCVKGVSRCVLRVVAARHDFTVAMPSAPSLSACCWPLPDARLTRPHKFRRRSATTHPLIRPRSARRGSQSRTMVYRPSRRRCAARPPPTIRASRGARTTGPFRLRVPRPLRHHHPLQCRRPPGLPWSSRSASRFSTLSQWTRTTLSAARSPRMKCDGRIE